MYQQLGKSMMLPLFLHCHTFLWLAEKIAHIFLNQSGLNKQIVTDSRSFTRALWRLQVIVSKADWFIWISARVVIGDRSFPALFDGYEYLYRKLIGSFEFVRLWLVTVIT